MTKTNLRRSVQMSIVSVLFALVAFSFLAVGGASARTINAPAHATSSTTNTVHIRPTSNGSFAFSVEFITVKVGTTVTIINNTKARQILFSNNPIVFVVLAPGQAQTITPQLGLERIDLYDTASNLNITTIR